MQRSDHGPNLPVNPAAMIEPDTPANGRPDSGDGDGLVIAPSRYGRQGILLAGATAASRLGGLVLVPLYTRRLAASELGVVAISTAVGALVQILSTLSLDNAAARWIGTAPSLADAEVTMATWFRLQVRASVAAAFVLGLTSLAVPDGTLRSSLLIVAATNVVLAPSTVLATCFRQWARVRPVIASSLLGALTAMLLSALFVVQFDMGAPGVAAGTFCGAVVSSSIALFALLPRLAGRAPDRTRGRELLRFGVPLLPGAAAQWISSLVDRFFVAASWGTVEVGRYQVAQFCSAGPAIFAVAFQASWGPWALSTMRAENSAERIGRATHLSLLFGSVVCLGYSAILPELVPLLAPGYVGLLPDIVLLTHAQLFLTATFAIAAGPMILRRTREVGIAMAAGAVLNVSLNAVLIEPLGLRGAAIATVVSFVFVPIVMLVLSRPRIIIPVPWVRLVLTAAPNFVLAVASVQFARDSVVLRLTLFSIGIAAVALLGLTSADRHQIVGALRRRLRPRAGLTR